MSLAGRARDTGQQLTHFIRRRIRFNDVGLAAGVRIGRLPARAFISRIHLHKVTAFNSTATDTIALGTTALGVDILAATDIKTATGVVDATAAAGLGLAVTGSGEVDVFLNKPAGTDATVGDVTLTIHYIPDNDG